MPSLTSRAEAILVQARKLDAYLESKSIPYPSFEEDTLDQLPDELKDDRWALANSTNELKKLARGAVMGTLDMALSVCILPFFNPLLRSSRALSSAVDAGIMSIFRSSSTLSS